MDVRHASLLHDKSDSDVVKIVRLLKCHLCWPDYIQWY